MADILRAVGGIFDGVNQAVYSVFQLVGAFGRLNSAFINGVIQAGKDCCFAVSMIGTSLWAALLEILCYIADFFLEVFHVFYGLIKVVSKIGILIYMLCGALLQILSIAFEWLMKFFLEVLRHCYKGLLVLGTYVDGAWIAFKAAFFDATASTAETARSVGNQTLTTGQKAAEYTADFFAVVGDSIVDLTLELYGAVSHFFESCVQGVTSYVSDIWSCIVINLQEIAKLLTFPGNISTDIKESLQDYFPHVELTFYDLLVILLIPSGTIFFVRIAVNYLNRKGMTFPLVERPRPARIRPPYRTHFVESSDEDLTEDYGNDSEEEYDEDDDEEMGEEEEDFLTDQAAIAVFAAGEVDYDESDDFDGDAYDDSEVEEFEVATDSEESEEEEDMQIKVELPHYNLRERATSDDPVFRQKLTPEELEKILENERDRRICVVCTDQPKTVVVLPCKHMCLCVDCAHEIVKQRSARRVCPLCRSRFNTVMHIYA